MADQNESTRTRGCGGGGRGRGTGAARIPVQRAVRALGAQPVVGARARPGDRPAQLRGARRERAGGDGVDLRAPLPRRVQRRAAARAVPARRAELRRAAAARDAGRGRAPPPAGRAAHLRGGVRRRAAASTPCARSPTATWISSPSALYERLEHYVGQSLGELGRGRVPRGRRRLPPARRGRDRAHGAEPRRQPVRAARRSPGSPRASASSRATRRGTSASASRTSAGAWSEAPERTTRRDHARDGGAARRSGRSCSGRPTPSSATSCASATASSRSTSTRRPCGWSQLRLASVGYDRDFGD